MTDIDTVFFDIGSVLCNPREGTYREIADETGVPFQALWKHRDTYWKDLSRGKLDEDEYWTEIIDSFSLDYSVDELKEKIRDGFEVYDATAEAAEELAEEGYTLGIISNHYTPWADEILARSGAEDCFDDDLVFISSDEELRKPDQRLYRQALEKAEAEPEQVLFIDDQAANIESADQLGIWTIHLQDPEELYGRVKNEGLL